MNIEKSVINLPQISWKSLRSIENANSNILITSPTALTASQDLLGGIRSDRTIVVSSSKKNYAEQLANEKLTADTCYLIGGGQVADIGRYLAHAWNSKAVCVPTVVSTDAFLVDCTGLRANNGVVYEKTKKADEVVLDRELLDKADWKYHLSGCGDVLSIFTGLYDWKLANERQKANQNELFDTNIAMSAKGILDGLISQANEVKKGSQKGLETIVTSLAMEVQLCNFYGNSRCEEGGEHFFTYCIETKMQHFLHGEMVAFGVLLTGYLQGQDTSQIKGFMDKVGLNYKPEGINSQLVVDVLQEIPQYVEQQHLAYSIYNEFDYSKQAGKLNKFFKSVNL